MYEEKDSQLYLQNPQGDISEITGDFINPMNGSFGNSPDEIAFMAIDENADEWDIFLYDDKTVTNLTQKSGYKNEDPKWSPDGKSIVFKRGYLNSETDDFTYNIALIDVESKEIKMLTESLYEDGKFNAEDIVLLQKWLLAVPDIKLKNQEATDLCEDDKLNVFDICLMKRKLLSDKPEQRLFA